VLVEEVNALLDQRNGCVGRDLVKHHELRATGGQCIGQAVQQTQLGDDAVGDDQDLAVAKTGNRLAQAAAGTGADQQRGLRNRDEAGDQTRALHQSPQTFGADGVAHGFGYHRKSPGYWTKTAL